VPPTPRRPAPRYLYSISAYLGRIIRFRLTDLKRHSRTPRGRHRRTKSVPLARHVIQTSIGMHTYVLPVDFCREKPKRPAIDIHRICSPDRRRVDLWQLVDFWKCVAQRLYAWVRRFSGSTSNLEIYAQPHADLGPCAEQQPKGTRRPTRRLPFDAIIGSESL